MRLISRMAVRRPQNRAARLILKTFRHSSFLEAHTWPDLVPTGTQKPIFCLSFDCDTEEDTRELPRLLDQLDNHSIPASFALIGELVEEEPETYRTIPERNYEVVNHGYSHHTAKRPDGSFYSSRFYHQLSVEEIRTEIFRNHELLESLIGAAVRGFRTPHFSTYQTAVNRQHIYALCREIGYDYSSSITSIHLKGSPDSTSKDVVEIPLAGCWDDLRSPFDSWGLIAAPDRRYADDDFFDLFAKMLAASLTARNPVLVNIYVDPSHVVDFDGYHRMLGELARNRSDISLLNYGQLVDSLRGQENTPCAE